MGTAPIAGSASPSALAAASSSPETAAAPSSWGTVSNGAARPADFASDLAHLMSLLVQGRHAMADAEQPADAQASACEPDSSTTSVGDVVASLWAELGLALSSPEAASPSAGTPLRAHAGIAPAASGASAGLPADGSAEALHAAGPPVSAVPGPVNDATTLLADAPAPPSNDPASTPASSSTSPAVSALVEPARPGAAAVAVAAAAVDLRQPQAPQQIAESVAWHVGKGVSEVRIRLNPEDLGPLDIKLKMDGDKVSVRFDTADVSVRDVVQTSLPTLSSLLSARGLQLDQAQVFSQNRGHGAPQPHPHSPSEHASQGAERGDEMSVSPGSRPFVRRGLLDDYA